MLFSFTDAKFNRNIVECKFYKPTFSGKRFIGLIETLWNVNTIGWSTPDSYEWGLIETLWNVNQPAGTLFLRP